MSMPEAEFKAEIRTKTDEQLMVKLRVGDIACRGLAQESDPRAPAAIARMRQEQRWIMDVQAERARAAREQAGLPEPEPVAVGLRALRLSGRAPAAR